MPRWTPNYKLSIEPIDQQHAELFGIASDLYDSIAEGRGKAAISAILDRLVRYTGMHFETEEKLMTESGYLDLAEHIAEHRKFTQQVLELQNGFRQGRGGLRLEVLQLMADWIQNHIRDDDSRYGPVVRAHLAA